MFVLLLYIDGSRLLYVFFFFKQKTAYEMRISDWSSDVCSSDLAADPGQLVDRAHRFEIARGLLEVAHRLRRPLAIHLQVAQVGVHARHGQCVAAAQQLHACAAEVGQRLLEAPLRRTRRSEEHTSELQSLMRISYAVFCLKKKTTSLI